MTPAQNSFQDPPQGHPASAQLKQPSPSTSVLEIAGIEAGPALARFAGNQARYEHWLSEFISHGPAAVTQIRQAILHGSHDTAISLAHALKGRTGMLGMNELQCIAISLEIALRNSEPTTLWMNELEQTTAEMSQRLTEALGQHQPQQDS